MTPRENMIVAPVPTPACKVANDIIWDNKLNSLPVVDDDDHLMYLVFRKDYDSHKSNPNEMLDAHKRYHGGRGHQHARLRRARAGAGGGRCRRAVHRLFRGLLRLAEVHASSGSASTTATP